MMNTISTKQIDEFLSSIPNQNPSCLPYDLLFKIFELLDQLTFQSCFSVCKRWTVALTSPNYDERWKQLLKAHFPNKKTEHIQNFKAAYKNHSGLLIKKIEKGIFSLHSFKIGKRFSSFFVSNRIIYYTFMGAIQMLDIKSNQSSTPLTKGGKRLISLTEGKLYVENFFNHAIEIWDISSNNCESIDKSHTVFSTIPLHKIISLTLINGEIYLTKQGDLNNKTEILICDLNLRHSHTLTSLWHDQVMLVTSKKNIILINDTKTIISIYSFSLHTYSKILLASECISLACEEELQLLSIGLNNGQIIFFCLKTFKILSTLQLGMHIMSFNKEKPKPDALAFVDGRLYVKSDTVRLFEFDFATPQ